MEGVLASILAAAAVVSVLQGARSLAVPGLVLLPALPPRGDCALVEASGGCCAGWDVVHGSSGLPGLPHPTR